MWWPTEAQRAAAIFENQYVAYAEILTRYGRTPASREVILEEARWSPLDPVSLLKRKTVRLEP